MKLTTIIIGLLLVHGLSFGANFSDGDEPNAKGAIFGKIYDQVSKQPLGYVSVGLLDQDNKTVTGGLTKDDGSFMLSKVPHGKYNLIIQFVGYVKVQKEVEVSSSSSKIDVGEVLLETNVEELDEVEIVGETQLIENHIDKKVINVSKAMIANGNSTSEILNTLPEINVGADGSISLRGDNNVRVLLDGKPSQLDINQLLQSLPADAVEKIEVITNPSSKYDPDGLSGIINIVTKKDAFKGLNGNFNLNAGTNNKYSGYLGLNYRVSKLNFFAQTYMSDDEWDNTREMTRTFDDENTNNFFQTENMNENSGFSMYKGGFDVFWDSTNTTTLSVQRWQWKSNSQSDFNGYYLDRNENVVDTEFQRGRNYNLGGGYNFNLNHRKEFKKGELELDVFANTGEAEFTPENAFQQGEEMTPLNRNSNNATWLYGSFQADYDQKINDKSSFEVGYKGELLSAKLDIENINYVSDDSLVYGYPYESQIHAMYGSYSLKLNKTSFKVGFRGEAAHMEGKLQSESLNDTSFVIDYASIFPSIHIKQQVGEKSTFGVSYSRRIKRPDVMQLLPSEMSSNPKSVVIGNPSLQPSYTNSMELSYNYMGTGKVSVNSALYMRHSTDIIREVLDYREETDVTVTTYANLGESMTGGLSLSSDYRMLDWWSWNGSLDLYYLDIKDTNEELTIPVEGSPLNWSAKLNTKITPMKGLTLQIMGRYTADRYDAQRITEPAYSMDIALKKSILKNKGSVNLKVNNLLYSGELRTVYGNGFNEFVNYQQESPVYRVSFSYAFGGQFQGRQKRNISSGGGGL
ncbi:TonB-dependent receptor [Flammeovirga sp. MY04]|uniref:outer membrane beta-barrel family protein n=1 Tax=Flammeovirga sp. MY04 TaxID=1191459 RepID=UPI0008062DBE|nr:outer membrane beta-barrel family protein [Flammeovirga sp. MY04]ANQ48188.1 TonB-dependent receptor [Flammeovirga sp. MY04]